MERILHSLSDKELSHIGRLRQESVQMKETEAKHRQQIATLEEQNRQLRAGNDAMLCELRVAEADFRIQQNLINEVFYLTEDRLKSLGVNLNSRNLSAEAPVVNESQRRVEVNHTSRNSPTETSNRQEVNLPGNATLLGSSYTFQPALVEKKREQPLVPNHKSSLKASSCQPAPVPEPKKEPLTPEQMKARANALRRSQLKKPVCWLFQEGKCLNGPQCKESHDTVPFEFCRVYNDTGVCPNRSSCPRKHVLFDYEQSMKDSSEILKHRQIDPSSAAQAAEAWELNKQERERLENIQQEKLRQQKPLYTREVVGDVTYSHTYLGQAAVDRAAQERRERERLQREERAKRMALSDRNGDRNDNTNGDAGAKRK